MPHSGGASSGPTHCCTRSSREPGDRLQRRRDLGGARPPGAGAPPRWRGAAGRGDRPVPQRLRPLPRARAHAVGRRVPVDRRARDRGPDRPHRSGGRPRVGRRRGRPRRGARHGRDRRRLPHLRPRLLRRRGLRTVRRLRRAPGAPARLDGVPPPRRPSGRGAHLLRAVELRGDVGAPDPGRRRRRHRRAGPHGHGDDRRRARGGCGDGHRHRRLAGSIPPRHRVARRCRSRDRRRAGGRGRARRRHHRGAAWPTS